jgi:hypothetical protein
VDVGLSGGKECYSRLTAWIATWCAVCSVTRFAVRKLAPFSTSFQTAIIIVCSPITMTVHVVQLLGLPFESTIINAFPNLGGVTFLRKGGSEPAKLVQVYHLFF